MAKRGGVGTHFAVLMSCVTELSPLALKRTAGLMSSPDSDPHAELLGKSSSSPLYARYADSLRILVQKKRIQELCINLQLKVNEVQLPVIADFQFQFSFSQVLFSPAYGLSLSSC